MHPFDILTYVTVCLDTIFAFPLHSDLACKNTSQCIVGPAVQQLQDDGQKLQLWTNIRGFLAKVAKYNDFMDLRKSHNSRSAAKKHQSSKPTSTARRSLFQVPNPRV